MSWTKLPERTKTEYKRTEWLDLSEGKHIIRILSETPYTVTTHTIQMQQVKCLDKDCPLCRANQPLWKKYGKEAWKQDEFNSQQTRTYANVLDKTSVKICPNTECQAEIKATKGKFPKICPKCKQVLTSIETHPLNKVKVYNMGVKVRDQLVELYNDMFVKDGAIVTGALLEEQNLNYEDYDNAELTTYDLEFTTVGESKTKQTLVEATDPLQCEPVEVPTDALYDLEKCIHVLTPEEMLEAKRGVKFKDIYAARRVSDEVKTDTKLEDEVDDVEDEVKKLFKEEEEIN